jgi:hypothetical protein
MTAGYFEHHPTHCPPVVQQATHSHIPHIVHQDHSEFLHITFINIPCRQNSQTSCNWLFRTHGHGLDKICLLTPIALGLKPDLIIMVEQTVLPGTFLTKTLTINAHVLDLSQISLV